LSLTIDFEPQRAAIFDAIHRAINGTLAENDKNATPIQRAEAGIVRPAGVGYVEYKMLTGLLARGLKDELRYDSDLDKFYLYGVREFVTRIEAFGEKAGECTAQIQLGFSSPVICEILRAADLSVIDDNTITDATLFLETEHEPRSILDVRMATALKDLDIVDGLSSIESVGLENQIYSTPLEVILIKP